MTIRERPYSPESPTHAEEGLRVGTLALAALAWAFFISACWTLALAENVIQGSRPITQVALGIPVGITALGFAATRIRHRHVVLFVATSLLAIFSLVGAASIGLFYFPSAVLMGFAAAQSLENRSQAKPR